jgi:hypothetical protein
MHRPTLHWAENTKKVADLGTYGNKFPCVLNLRGSWDFQVVMFEGHLGEQGESVGVCG